MPNPNRPSFILTWAVAWLVGLILLHELFIPVMTIRDVLLTGLAALGFAVIDRAVR